MRAKKLTVISFLIILGLLAVSVWFNFQLFGYARYYFLQLNGLQLNPLGLDSFPAVDAAEEPGDMIRIVFFGDSRAASWSAPDVEGFEFVNRGIGGQTSVQVRERYEEHVRPLGPDILLVQVCINDLKMIGIFPERKAEIVRNCQNNIREITDLANEDGAMVILTTVFPVGEVPLERQIFWSDDISAGVVEVNGFIEGLESEGVVVFDAYEILVDGDGEVQGSFEFDELHLNAAGYEALNGELVGLLKSLRGEFARP